MPNTIKVNYISSHIIKNYSEVSLYIDVMHVNGIMFLMGLLKHIGLIHCVWIRKKYRDKILEAILIMIHGYRSQGFFNVISIGADKASKLIKSELEDKPYQVVLTTCSAIQIDMLK